MSPGRSWARAAAVQRLCRGLTLLPLAAHVFGEVGGEAGELEVCSPEYECLQKFVEYRELSKKFLRLVSVVAGDLLVDFCWRLDINDPIISVVHWFDRFMLLRFL